MGKKAKQREAQDAYRNINTPYEAIQRNITEQMAQKGMEYMGKTEDLLNKPPQYDIPAQIAQYQNLMSGLGSSYGSAMGNFAARMGDVDYLTGGKEQLTSDFASMMGALQSGYGEAKDIYGQGATSLRNTINQGLARSAELEQQGATQTLGDVAGFTDYYRQLAGRQEMPGQRGMENRIGRSYAEGYKALQQQAGSSASGLGAMVDLYSNKANAMSDIGIQAAQYKAQQEQQLAAAKERATAIRSDIYNQLSQGALQRSQIGAQAEQAATGMQAGAATNMANAMAQGYQTRGTTMADYASLQQNNALNVLGQQAGLYQQGIMGQANLQGQGLMAGAEAANQAYQYNQLMPWQTQANYYAQMSQAMNPYTTQLNYWQGLQNRENAAFQTFNG